MTTTYTGFPLYGKQVYEKNTITPALSDLILLQPGAGTPYGKTRVDILLDTHHLLVDTERFSLVNAGIDYSSGTIASKAPSYLGAFVYGATSTIDSIVYMGLSDQVNYTGSTALDGLSVLHSIGGSTFAGNRNAIRGRIGMLEAANPGTVGTDYSVFNAEAYASVNNGGTPGGISAAGSKVAKGSFWGYSSNTRLATAATYWLGLWGAEHLLKIEAGCSAQWFTGSQVTILPGHRSQGYVDDAGYMVASQDDVDSPGWNRGYSIGSLSTQWPMGADSTLVEAVQRRYGGAIDVPTVAKRGVNFQAVTFSESAWLSTHAFVDPVGAAYLNGLTTTGSLSARTATLTGVTVVDGGAFLTKPVLAVDAAPSGGSTATATVATMGLSTRAGNGVQTITAGGTGYVVGNTLTVAGGTGTAPTIQVDAVNGSGVITAASVLSQGSMSVLPSNPVSVTGGAGSAATFTLTWAILTVTVSGAGSGYPEKPVPRILAAQNDYWAPVLTAAMTGVTAILALNPAGNTRVGTGAAVATNAVLGLLLLPTCAGVPTGTIGGAGGAAMIVDSTNHKAYVNDGGGWFALN